MFIDILEKTLKEKNVTFNKLAKETGIGQSSTDRWKKGSYPSIDKLVKICQYLNVSADYLLELNIEPPADRIDRLTEQEQRLIENFRKLDDRAKEFIFDMAAREAEKIKEQERLSNSKIS